MVIRFLKSFRRILLNKLRYLITWSTINNQKSINLCLIKIHNKISASKLYKTNISNFEKNQEIILEQDKLQDIKIVAPRFFGKKSAFIYKKSKTIKLFKLNNVFAFPRSALLLNQDYTLAYVDCIYSNSKEIDFGDNYIHELNNRFLVYKNYTQRTQKFNDAVNLLGNGSWNYFHIIMDYG